MDTSEEQTEQDDNHEEFMQDTWEREQQEGGFLDGPY